MFNKLFNKAEALCTCGHSQEAHKHYRAGSDCGLCPDSCKAYRQAH